MHSEYDSAESIVDSDLEDGEIRKTLPSQLYLQISCILAGKRSKCTSSSQEPRAPGKLAAMFHLAVKSWEANSRVLFSKMLIRQIGDDLFLTGTRQDLTQWSKNIKLDLSIFASVSCNNKLYAQRLE